MGFLGELGSSRAARADGTDACVENSRSRRRDEKNKVSPLYSWYHYEIFFILNGGSPFNKKNPTETNHT